MWQLAADDALAIRRWGDECILFDAVTGDTHLLDAGSAEILDRFIGQPTATQSWDSLQRVDGEQELEAVLADFERYGFIIRV